VECRAPDTIPGMGNMKAAVMGGVPRQQRRLPAVLAIIALFGFSDTLWASTDSALPRPRPETPEPRILSAADVALFQEAHVAAQDGKWSVARMLSRHGESEIARTLIEWMYLRDPDSGASFGEITAFLESQPEWPRRVTLMRRAEEALPDTMPAAQVIAWFDGRDPLTGVGQVRLGAAHIQQSEREKGVSLIRRAWIEHNFPRDAEETILRRHGQHIDAASHAARLDRLLWEHNIGAARRVMRFAPADRQALAEARIRLATLAAGVDAAIGRVPPALQNDASLLYERIRWRRRRGRHDDTWPLLLTAPGTAEEMVRPELWWTERHIQARRALRSGHHREAYTFAANHGLTAGVAFAEGEWLAGWIAMRFLNDPAQAYAHFQRLEAGVGFPISKARAQYWSGRAAVAMGDDEAARRHFTDAAEHFTTFYGLLAAEQLEGFTATLSFDPPPSIPAAERARLEQHVMIRAAKVAADLGDESLIRVFLDHLADQLAEPAQITAVIEIANDLGTPHLALRIAKSAMLRHMPLHAVAYPRSALAIEDNGLPPEVALVYAIARQESEFNPRAVSPAGAQGILQLMPATARQVASANGLPFTREWLLDRPDYNARLGQAYLADLLRRYDGSYIMATAAYNAGPHRVRDWIAELGDPRTGEIDPIDWIEMLPFGETRNYVQRVMEATIIYRSRLSGAPVRLTLSNDLNRGRR
jgi:soluble lytic murein transglycosylase